MVDAGPDTIHRMGAKRWELILIANNVNAAHQHPWNWPGWHHEALQAAHIRGREHQGSVPIQGVDLGIIGKEFPAIHWNIPWELPTHQPGS